MKVLRQSVCYFKTLQNVYIVLWKAYYPQIRIYCWTMSITTLGLDNYVTRGTIHSILLNIVHIQTPDLMYSADKVHVMLCKELGDYISSKGEGNPPVTLPPSFKRLIMIRVCPYQVTEQPYTKYEQLHWSSVHQETSTRKKIHQNWQDCIGKSYSHTALVGTDESFWYCMMSCEREMKTWNAVLHVVATKCLGNCHWWTTLWQQIDSRPVGLEVPHGMAQRSVVLHLKVLTPVKIYALTHSCNVSASSQTADTFLKMLFLQSEKKAVNNVA